MIFTARITCRAATLGRVLAVLSGAAWLSGCATTHPAMPLTATQEAATYVARAKPSYAPPGPPEDPWGPYIAEASKRYDVPERWIREVMRVESGAHEYTATGTLITSPVGAMGLMQVMPETYDEVRARYGLGDDAFDPHNNILAGTAYIREMYDAFGSPGFLAAYNGGPARLDDYLNHNRPLPTETRRYVAMIGPYIEGIYPQSRAPAEQYAANRLPINIPAGPRYPRHVNVALASRGRRGHEAAIRIASVDRHAARRVPAAPPQPIEVAEAPPVRAKNLSLIDSAYASENIGHAIGGRGWAIQVGAYGNPAQARAASGAARAAVAGAHATIAPVRSGHATLYRARLSGLSHDSALQACHKLARGSRPCIVVSPAAE